MSTRTLITWVVAAGLTVAAAAHETRDDSDRCERRRDGRSPHSRREERCVRPGERAHHERRDRRECEPPVYATVPLPAYYAAVVWRAANADGRFHPMPIPGRPVYVLPGMP